jgi:hypothetical protein
LADRLATLADSYLDHIRIAVEAGDRGAPFRDFLDNWNAFRCEHDHHRSRGDRPRWFNNPSALARPQMLDALDFRSTGAAAIIADAVRDPQTYQRRYAARDRDVKLIVDHAVPIGVMVGALFAGSVELTRDGIRTHLVGWYRLGLLCHSEDASLNAKGLRSAMPASWDGNSLFARYEAAGISPCKALQNTIAANSGVEQQGG